MGLAAHLRLFDVSHLHIRIISIHEGLDLFAQISDDENKLDIQMIGQAVELIEHMFEYGFASQAHQLLWAAPGMRSQPGAIPGHRDHDFQGFRHSYSLSFLIFLGR